ARELIGLNARVRVQKQELRVGKPVEPVDDVPYVVSALPLPEQIVDQYDTPPRNPAKTLDAPQVGEVVPYRLWNRCVPTTVPQFQRLFGRIAPERNLNDGG